MSTQDNMFHFQDITSFDIDGTSFNLHMTPRHYTVETPPTQQYKATGTERQAFFEVMTALSKKIRMLKGGGGFARQTQQDYQAVYDYLLKAVDR